MGRTGSVPILPVKQIVTIGTMLYFDGDGHAHGDGDGTCKKALSLYCKHYQLCVIMEKLECFIHLNLVH